MQQDGHRHIWHILHYMFIDQWSSFRPNALTRPRKAPARSIHSSTEEQHCGFSQTVTHPSNNAANCCLTSIVVTLAFYHSAIGKRQNSSGDLSTLSHISQCILIQPFTEWTLHIIGKEFHLVSKLYRSYTLIHSPLYGHRPVERIHINFYHCDGNCWRFFEVFCNFLLKLFYLP